MPLIRDHPSSSTTKLLLIGHSSSGKTGSLASLPPAGFNLRIIDLDNGLDILKSYLTDSTSPYVKQDPECASRVSSITLTDSKIHSGGRVFSKSATVWKRAME